MCFIYLLQTDKVLVTLSHCVKCTTGFGFKMNIAKTPLNKRRNTEMEFSPEEQKSMGSINAELLKEILDKKLTQHISPLKEEIVSFKIGLQDLKCKEKIVVLKLKQNL